jgi:hypothetical protein
MTLRQPGSHREKMVSVIVINFEPSLFVNQQSGLEASRIKDNSLPSNARPVMTVENM